eukprot:6183373-Pleurochrysis_carterae.AAC.1
MMRKREQICVGCKLPLGTCGKNSPPGGMRSARKTNIDYFLLVFAEREWRACDIAFALSRSSLLKENVRRQ